MKIAENIRDSLGKTLDKHCNSRLLYNESAVTRRGRVDRIDPIKLRCEQWILAEGIPCSIAKTPIAFRTHLCVLFKMDTVDISEVGTNDF